MEKKEKKSSASITGIESAGITSGTSGSFAEGFGNTKRRLPKALPSNVFAQALQKYSDGVLDGEGLRVFDHHSVLELLTERPFVQSTHLRG